MNTKFEKCLHLPIALQNTLITGLFLFLATLLCFLFCFLIPVNLSPNIAQDDSSLYSINTCLFYVLAIVLTTRYTKGYIYGIVASIIGVFCVNYFFAYPYFKLNFSITGYPVTFVTMTAVSILTSAATTHLKQQSLELAKREKLLMIAEKEKMRANLLSAVSHDLRTPLTSIIGAADSYLEHHEQLSELDKLSLICQISTDSSWLLKMVENLLSVTRIHKQESFQVTKSLELVEEVISEAVLRTKKLYPEAEIEVTIPDELLFVPMDAILIEQVLLNLLENAITHSKSKKPIQCIVENRKTNVFITIKDYGIGIPPDHLENIFNENGEWHSPTSDGRKGMGIGLSICQTIIAAHKGTLNAKNHSNGAEFCFSLFKEDKFNAT